MAMTTLLTLAAMFGAVRQNTPRVGDELVVVMVVVVVVVVKIKKYETKCASGNS